MKDTVNEALNLINKVESIWKNIKNREITKEEVITKLSDINRQITPMEKKINYDILFELSQMIIRTYEIINVIPNDKGFVFTSLAMKHQDEVYYVFYQSQLKEFLSLPWFFPLFQKTQKIAENDDFVLVKDKNISNLIVLSSMVLDEKKNIIFCRDEQVALQFFESIKRF